MIDILLVDDNPTDALIVREAIDYIGLAARLHCLENGNELLPFVRGEQVFAGQPRPHLILLDISLAHRNGFELLSELKADAALKHIPVIMLSASANTEDVERAFRLQAACYIVKPPSFEGMVEAVRAVGRLWGALDRQQAGR